MIYLATIFFVLMTSFVEAATLIWDATNTGPLTIERGTSPTGPFTTVATVPDGTTRFILTPEAWGHYRVRNQAGPSNTVEYRADLYAGPIIDRLDAIEARLVLLETDIPTPPPAPTSNFTVTVIDADHIRIVGNCTSMRTTGSGTQRTIECVH